MKPQAVCNGGNRTIADIDNFFILKGMALYLLRLDKNGIREPHWHPNAAELSYCIDGRALMTIYSPDARHDTFTVDQGEIVFVPRGYIHHIENITEKETKFVLAFNHEKPEDLGISGSVGSMPDRALDATFSIKSKFFSQFEKSPVDILIGTRSSSDSSPVARTDYQYHQRIPNSHKFNLEGIPPQIQTTGGTVALGNANSFPILSGLACYSLHLRSGGIREPHWHPNAAELDYIIKGRAKMTILSPGGEADTFEVKAGEIVFIPPGYLHYIENIDVDDTHFAVFFGHERPEDIGISGALSAYSNEVLSGIFGTDPKVFESLARVQEDIFVVAGGA